MSKRNAPVSRRTFLRRAAFAAGAFAIPEIVPDTALGLGGHVAAQ